MKVRSWHTSGVNICGISIDVHFIDADPNNDLVAGFTRYLKRKIFLCLDHTFDVRETFTHETFHWFEYLTGRGGRDFEKRFNDEELASMVAAFVLNLVRTNALVFECLLTNQSIAIRNREENKPVEWVDVE